MKHSDRAPIIQAILIVLVIIVYFLLVDWIIPRYISPGEQEIAIKNTSYGFTAATTLIFAGQYFAYYLDFRKSKA